MLSQANTAQESYNQALNSSGETMKQNEVYMGGLEAKTALLRAEFEKFVIGDGGLQSLAKELVTLATLFVNFINQIGGLPTIIKSLTVAFVALKSTDIAKYFLSGQNAIGNFISVVGELITKQALAKAGYQSFALGVEEANMLMQASIPIIGLVLAGVTALGMAIVSHNQKVEEQKQKVRELASTLTDEYAILDNAITKLKDEKISREELDSIIDSNVDKYEAERLKLLDENEARKEAIRLIEEEKKAKAQELVDTGLTAYEDALNNLKNGFKEFEDIAKDTESAMRVNLKTLQKESGFDTANTLQEQIDALKKYKDALVEQRSTLDKNSSTYKMYTAEIERVESALSVGNESYKENKKTVEDFDNALKTIGKHYDENTNSFVEGAKRSFTAETEMAKGLAHLEETSKKSVEELNELVNKYDITEEAIQEYIDAQSEENVTREEAIEMLALQAEEQSNIVKSYDELSEAWDASKQSVSTLISSISKLSSALKEEKENGSLSLQTQLDLIDSGYAMALVYDKETGACKLDKEALVKLTQAKLEMQIANLKIERSNVVSQLQKEGAQAVSTAKEFLALASAKTLAAQAEGSYRDITDPSKSTSGYGGNFGYISEATKESRDLLNNYNKEIEVLEKTLNNLEKNGTKAFDNISSSTNGARSSADKANDALEKLKSNYDKVASYITSSLDKKIKAIQKEKDSALDAIETEIKGIERKKDSALNAIEETIKAREKEKDTALKNIEAQIKAVEKEKDARLGDLKSRKKELQDAQDKEIDAIQLKIDLLSEEKEAIVDATQTEIDALKELQEEREKYWDAQIDALKEANEQRKDSLELQEKLDALEKARNTKVKVYKKGEGFVYDVDQTKVAEAQKALDEYLSEKAYEDELERLENLKKAEIDNYADRIDALTDFKNEQSKNYQAQIDELTKLKNERKKIYDEEINALSELIDSEQEKYDNQLDILKEQKENLTEYYSTMLDELKEYKDSVQNSYEEQISALEEHKDALGKNYDQEIEYYQNYKDKFEEMVNAYEDQQNKLLFAQLTGLSAENDNWMTRLDNLAKFVNEYNKLKSQLDSGTTSATSNYNGTSTVKKTTVTTTPPKVTANPNYAKGSTAGMPDYAKKYAGIPTHASGISSVKDNEVAIVGEDPNKELVIGSKVNNGQLMSLSKGSGVVNAKSTKSMAGLLNQIGSFSGSSFGAGNGTLNNTTNNDTFTINGVTVNGANITDAQSFATALMNLKSEAISRAYRRNK